MLTVIALFPKRVYVLGDNRLFWVRWDDVRRYERWSTL